MNRCHEILRQLLPYATPMPQPLEGDWLAENSEDGETIDQFDQKDKRRPPSGAFNIAISCHRTALLRIPNFVTRVIDEFYPGSRASFEKTALLLDETLLQPRPSIGFGEQILADGLMSQVTPPNGYFAHLAFTGSDIYYNPKDAEDWGYGYSNWQYGSAIVATARCKNLFTYEGGRRFIKLALHELGHLFCLPHCVMFRCLMNGINNDTELDAILLELCPECLAKYVLFSGCRPKARFDGLHRLWTKAGWWAEATRARALSTRLAIGTDLDAEEANP